MLTSKAAVEGEIENISSKGAFVSCKDLPPLEDGFVMVIKAPDHKTMNLNGKIVWSTVIESGEGATQFGIGVQFTRMTSDDSQFLHSVSAKQ
jgi:Tfp pilus assembly protein PilZ